MAVPKRPIVEIRVGITAAIFIDGYVGIQKASNVLELCNAHEYATMLLEGNYDAYQSHFKQSIVRNFSFLIA